MQSDLDPHLYASGSGEFFGLVACRCGPYVMFSPVRCLLYENTPNILKYYHQKNKIFQIKNVIFFIFLLKT